MSATTSVPVVGEGAGSSELSEAEATGTPIVPAERFEELLPTGELPA